MSSHFHPQRSDPASQARCAIYSQPAYADFRYLSLRFPHNKMDFYCSIPTFLYSDSAHRPGCTSQATAWKADSAHLHHPSIRHDHIRLSRRHRFPRFRLHFALHMLQYHPRSDSLSLVPLLPSHHPYTGWMHILPDSQALRWQTCWMEPDNHIGRHHHSGEIQTKSCQCKPLVHRFHYWKAYRSADNLHV